MGVAKSTEWIGYRLLNRIAVSPSGCFNWKLSCDRNGYGQSGLEGRTRYAHVMSFETFRGPVPAGQCVLHRCDNPQCINPAHLFLGTRRDNSHDCVGKGRNAWGERVGSARLKNADVARIAERYAAGESANDLAAAYRVCYGVIRRVLIGEIYRGVERTVFEFKCGMPGESHHQAKLTDDDVREIRKAAATGTSRAVLARKYGVSGTHVSKIVLGKAWQHLLAATESG